MKRFLCGFLCQGSDPRFPYRSLLLKFIKVVGKVVGVVLYLLSVMKLATYEGNVTEVKHVSAYFVIYNLYYASLSLSS